MISPSLPGASQRSRRSANFGGRSDKTYPLPHPVEHLAGSRQGLHTLGLYAEVAPRPASALGGRIGEPGSYAALRFQAVERRIERSDGYFPLRLLLDLAPDRDAVGL